MKHPLSRLLLEINRVFRKIESRHAEAVFIDGIEIERHTALYDGHADHGVMVRHLAFAAERDLQVTGSDHHAFAEAPLQIEIAKAW